VYGGIRAGSDDCKQPQRQQFQEPVAVPIGSVSTAGKNAEFFVAASRLSFDGRNGRKGQFQRDNISGAYGVGRPESSGLRQRYARATYEVDRVHEQQLDHRRLDNLRR